MASSDASNLLNLMLFEIEDDDKKMVGKINGYLNDRQSRLRGLLLLEQIIPSLPSDILVDNASRWMRLCSSSFLRGDKEDEGVILSFCKIVSLILEEAKNNPDISSGIGNQVVTQLAPVLTEAISWNMLSTLQSLNTLLKLFGGPCGNFRDSIRKAVLEQLQKKQVDGVAKALAECWARLPQTGGGGKQGENHTKMWSKQCKDTIATAHAILDDLFEGVTEYTTWHVTGETLFSLETEKATNENLVSRIIKLCSRFSNIMKCLQAMLCCEFPVHVAVPLNDLLELCFRCLGVTGERLAGRLTLQKRALLVVLSVLHTESLTLLKGVILGCGKNLLPHGEPIQDVIVQTLKGIVQKDPMSGRELPFRDVKTDAYDTLKLWLETAGSCSLYRSEVSSYLVSELLTDILRSEDKVEKKEENTGKKRKKLRNKSKWLPGPDSTMRCKAISVLSTIIYTNTPLLTSQVIKQIQEAALGSLAELQTNNLENCSPYTQNLRDLCTALLLSPHPLWPIPSQYASVLLGDLVGSSVSSSLCHPRAMPLDIPILIKEQTLNPETDVQERIEATHTTSSCSTQTEANTDSSNVVQQEESSDEESMLYDCDKENKRKREDEGEKGVLKQARIEEEPHEVTDENKLSPKMKEPLIKSLVTDAVTMDSPKVKSNALSHKKVNGFSEERKPSCDLKEMLSSFVDADPDTD